RRKKEGKGRKGRKEGGEEKERKKVKKKEKRPKTSDLCCWSGAVRCAMGLYRKLALRFYKVAKSNFIFI
ncbi:hypothetical protein, partial [Campylobacter jejuni]|uniref:hypothetical protein n=1 Tax=Campylobacter jejuni TaxID=197 RepID=UPI00196B2E1C